MIDLALVNGTAITETGELIKTNLGIDQGVIVEITPNDICAKEVIDCTNKYYSCSFVNAHAHTAMALLKGVAEDVCIEDWFNRFVWPYEKQLNGDDVYHGAMVGFQEMIHNGITVVADHYLFAEEVIKAALAHQIHLDMAPTIFSFGDISKDIEETCQLYHQYQTHPLIQISMGPHSCYTVNQSDLSKIATVAQEKKMKIHLHLSETQDQVEQHYQQHHQSPVETLKACHVLDQRTILAHGLVLSDGDQTLLENHHLVYCPKTYCRLAMPLSDSYQHTVKYTFGTDGPVTNGSLSVLEQASLYGMIGKLVSQDATHYPVKMLWQSLMRGHELFEFNTGKIEVGKTADLILWNFDLAETQAHFDVLATILYSYTSSHIEEVFCCGKRVKHQNIEESVAYVSRRQSELQESKLEPSDLVF